MVPKSILVYLAPKSKAILFVISGSILRGGRRGVGPRPGGGGTGSLNCNDDNKGKRIGIFGGVFGGLILFGILLYVAIKIYKKKKESKYKYSSRSDLEYPTY